MKKLLMDMKYGLVLIFGFSVSFFTFIYCNLADNVLGLENEDIDNIMSGYSENVIFDEYDEAMVDYINKDACVYMLDYMAGISGYYHITTVSFNHNNLNYPLISGHYPTDSDINSDIPCVVLGSKMHKYTVREGNQDYIYINYDKYKVLGYVKSNKSAIFNYKIILFYENLGANTKKNLMEYFKHNILNLIVRCDSADKLEKYNMRLESIKDKYQYEFGSDEEFFASESLDENVVTISKIVYVFSIVLVLFVLYYWYTNAKKEYAIKRTFGYSYFRLLLDFMMKIFLYICISVIIAEIVVFILNFIEKDYSYISVKGIVEHLIMVAQYVSITLLVIIVPAMIKLKFEKPINLVKE